MGCSISSPGGGARPAERHGADEQAHTGECARSRPDRGRVRATRQCLVIFVAGDSAGKSSAVPRWEPMTAGGSALEQDAIWRIQLRKDIEDAMRGQRYTAATLAREITLHFLAAPTDVTWGG